MELIFNNQISIFEDIFYKYLTPKQCTKLYTSNLILYNIFINNNKFESHYFTPKNNNELKEAVNKWCKNTEEVIIKYGHISYWNTIYITDMNELFIYDKEFDDDISDWNTSNVMNMDSMFGYAKKFNQPINNWDISNVINMKTMFYSATKFNQDLNKWNIYKVKRICRIFKNAINFNKINYSKWDLSNIECKCYMKF